MKPFKRILTIIFFLFNMTAFGQNAEMADTFRAEGKIYVVVAIVLIVLAGLLIYLFLMDRKVSALEKRIKEKM